MGSKLRRHTPDAAIPRTLVTYTYSQDIPLMDVYCNGKDVLMRLHVDTMPKTQARAFTDDIVLEYLSQ